MGTVLIFVLQIVSLSFTIITLGLSFWQINDEYTNIDKKLCDMDGVVTPFRATFKTGEIQCTWSVSRNAVRILYLLLFVALSVLLFVSIFRKSKVFFYMVISLILADCALGGYSFVYDAISSRAGNHYCHNNIVIFNDKTPHKCYSHSFYATTSMGILTVVMMFVVFVMSLIKRSRLMSSPYTQQK
ncbi:hypothetical protein DICPUDRAFT_92032 [Dictyostelium purpureum]|uniref:MARVEL domain-containing protein n=1 Tax=Dictyostelium purpureum TaxID=5786 RepID=F0ZKU8_DICPU|nr:uncharacterized protein DICPUDRAFT_92032 [Dictyostelium purpureum]EGC35423.1 hypothetical protein DICPUDRAFT_92032 [Dictyostelium purpureum]|eukprot:XP_003288036.1 hypothetical protein DICPUDRAFT_92032 [Dictyostelium purpureum]